MNKKVVVTGCRGLLGSAIKKIVETLPKLDYYVFLESNILDITDKQQTINIIQSIKPDYVINCAAYTNVDGAENDEESAHKINVEGTDNLAFACNLSNSKLIHISSDYVFDGTKNEPYLVTDNTNPLNVYGETKRDGEISALCYPNVLVFRTSWLYSDTHVCFFTKMLHNLNHDMSTYIISKEIGRPTNAYDFAKFLVTEIATDAFDNKSGIYHYSNNGIASRFEFAQAIEFFYNLYTGDNKMVMFNKVNENPISQTKRPKNVVLDLTKTESEFFHTIPDWRISLAKTCYNLFKNKKNMSSDDNIK